MGGAANGCQRFAQGLSRRFRWVFGQRQGNLTYLRNLTGKTAQSVMCLLQVVHLVRFALRFLVCGTAGVYGLADTLCFRVSFSWMLWMIRWTEPATL